MKTILSLFILTTILIISCTKKDTLPPYTPNTPIIFSVNNRMSHNKDTLNIGDTIILTAKGLIADTTNTFSTSLRTVTGSVNALGVFASAGVLVGVSTPGPTSKVLSAPSGTSSLYNWTAVYKTIVPAVGHKTNILVTGYFENSLSLSSQYGNQISSDSKAIYIR